MTLAALSFLLTAGFAGCGSVQDEAPARNVVAAGTGAEPRQAAAVEGRWRILSIDGEVPGGRRDGSSPFLTITGNSIGGSIGCNRFGSLALVADGHVATHSWISTAMGCLGKLGEQERALAMLMSARPAIQLRAPDRLVIASDAHRVELAREGPADSPPVPAGPAPLEGTGWRIVTLDGREASSSPDGRYIAFTAQGWQGLASCATLSGTWRIEDGRIVTGSQVATTEQLCRPDHAAIDDAFLALMRSNPRYLVGPNGELLIAGGGHSLAGGRAN